MPSLKALNVRIKSIRSTKKITSAMKMVSAARLKRAENALNATRPYVTSARHMLENLVSAIRRKDPLGESLPAVVAGRKETENHLLLIFSADRGLCGGFNAYVVRQARAKRKELEAAGQKVKFFFVGRKAYEMMRKECGDNIIEYKQAADFLESARQTTEQNLGLRIVGLFERKEIDACTVIFNNFTSGGSYTTACGGMLPLSIAPEKPLLQDRGPPSPFDAPETHEHDNADYDYEPSEAGLLDLLIPEYMTTFALGCLVSSVTAEYGARMVSMDAATRNAEDILRRLTLQYNRTRQATITTELTEIISGAEALN